MLSVSINHPDSESFIDAKMTEGKVTGANVSVKIDDEFMRAVINDEEYEQKYPVYSDEPKNRKQINARQLWIKLYTMPGNRLNPVSFSGIRSSGKVYPIVMQIKDTVRFLPIPAVKFLYVLMILAGCWL